MWVKNVRRAPSRRAVSTASSRPMCVTCGWGPQAIQDQCVEPCEKGFALGRETLDVGTIGHIADTVSQGRVGTMDNPNRCDPLSQYGKRLGCHTLDMQPRHAAGRVVARDRIKGVRKGLADVRFDVFFTVNRQVFAQVAGKKPQVVQPEQMVGVGMGIKHRMNQPDVLGQQLQPQLGRGVD